MNRSTWAYFGSYSLSLLGNGIASIVLPLLVLARTGDILAAGIVASVTSAVSAVIGLFAGVLIDRINRRTISIISDVISGSAVVALPIVDATVGLNLAWFIGLAVLGAFGDAPGMTAREALLPKLAKLNNERPDTLDRLVGTREALSGALMLAGPGLGGLLIAVFGVGSTTLFVTAATTLTAAVASYGIQHRAGDPDALECADKHQYRSPMVAVLSELGVALRFLFSQRLILGATALTALFVATSAALQTSLLPAFFAAEDLPGLTGLVVACLSAGSLVGAGIYAVTVGKISRRTWFVVGMIGTLVGYIGLGVMATPWLVITAAVVIGLAGAPVSAVIGVATIEATPDQMRGRVLSAQNTIMLAAPAVSSAPIAAVASNWGLPAAGLSLATVIGIVVAVSIVTPAFKNLDSVLPSTDADD
ncbi:MFS transporter [Auritidibacter ignavus]|uniref:MFS transporter n=1 Tax=Auritidibacter ignavus TaxID=678932 RepID=UPI0024BA78C2|nr:MFS transporter [Auritidibacter ignavus]WHS34371.1 MFS transporter [Auritidibacter ignavus]